MAHWLFQEEHEMLRKSVRGWVEKEIKPHVEEWEQKGEFPRELFYRAGELGFLGLTYPEVYGGSGEDYLAGAVFVEELARCGSAGVAAGLGASVVIAGPQIYKFGSEELKQKFLVPTITGEKIGALGITEPNAGSDVASISTTARDEGDHYVVNGSKIFITNGVRADYVVTAVKTDPAAGYKGISLLVIEKDTPGFTVAKKLEKLGWNASDTGELVFEDCRVPKANLVGKENMGFYYIMQNFAWERLVMALEAVAAAELALEEAIRYAQQRIQFKRPLSKFQVIRHKLADMASWIETARSLTYHALSLFASGEDAVTAVAMAKVYACETANRVADEALQIHGGYGYMMEYPVQRYWRDARVGTIGGGTTEIMKQIIVNRLIK
ncbi:acyl-CoA dehydrogenase family protein [Desulfallas sp. Bu1-1]|jgi:acyl-CoA dehydrogenase|uniref:acyl-CoA dehydrogenase family protein n=1 Tax=Desulfallas sp. Bu1-1 TaxID=2787620 RepID=UPI00189CD825|nr:acyl-CoA dehydrogenase family protein [Desulfallas sp. Bu1-1]MBF7082265.1 acyl-CoA dehydrogenase family protein [Desulfallas sp. Bu1-1]